MSRLAKTQLTNQLTFILQY